MNFFRAATADKAPRPRPCLDFAGKMTVGALFLVWLHSGNKKLVQNWYKGNVIYSKPSLVVKKLL